MAHPLQDARLRTSVALALLASWFAACGSSEPERPNLLLLVLDTARADATSVYGNPRPTTPFLESFAAQATRFDRAYSVSCWTLPAHASMFTGQLPQVHGADQASGRVIDGIPLLADLLTRAGYQSAGFSRNPWLSEHSGLHGGFDHFEMVRKRRGVPREEAINPAGQRARIWLEEQRTAQSPFFLFVNLIRPHLPYRPDWAMAKEYFSTASELEQAVRDYSSAGPRALFERHYARRDPLTEEDWAKLRWLYEAELRHTDAFVQSIVEAVEAVDDGRDTVILIVSDHGENLGDHDHAAHMFSLNEALIRVVFLARGPGFAPGATDQRLVQLTDVYATLLAAAGVEASSSAGRDLRAGATNAGDERLILTHIVHPETWVDNFPQDIRESGALDPYLRELWAVRDERYKLVTGSDGTQTIYDLELDPGESSALDPEEIDAERLRHLFAAIEAANALNESVQESGDMDQDLIDALRDLGY